MGLFSKIPLFANILTIIVDNSFSYICQPQTFAILLCQMQQLIFFKSLLATTEVAEVGTGLYEK